MLMHSSCKVLHVHVLGLGQSEFRFYLVPIVNEARVFCVSLVFSGLGCPCILLVYYFPPSASCCLHNLILPIIKTLV